MNNTAPIRIEMTSRRISQLVETYSRYAGEAVSIRGYDFLDEGYVVLGSEIACLRIFYRLKIGIVDYSQNLGTWYFSRLMD